MNFTQFAEQAQVEYDTKKAELDRRASELDSISASLEQQVKELADKKAEFTAKEEDLAIREAKVKEVEDIKDLEDKTSQDIHALAIEKGKLRAKENELFEIMQAQKAKEAELNERSIAVSEREVNYKQTIEDEFLKTIKTKLNL